MLDKHRCCISNHKTATKEASINIVLSTMHHLTMRNVKGIMRGEQDYHHTQELPKANCTSRMNISIFLSQCSFTCFHRVAHTSEPRQMQLTLLTLDKCQWKYNFCHMVWICCNSVMLFNLYTSVASVHPGKGILICYFPECFFPFFPMKVIFQFFGKFFLIQCAVLRQRFHMCTDCKVLWDKFVICVFGLYKIK